MNSICKLILDGGLGICKLRVHNWVLLAKWIWWFGVERGSLWHKVVVARFGEILAWKFKEICVRHGCGVWKSILVVSRGFLEIFSF